MTTKRILTLATVSALNNFGDEGSAGEAGLPKLVQSALEGEDAHIDEIDDLGPPSELNAMSSGSALKTVSAEHSSASAASLSPQAPSSLGLVQRPESRPPQRGSVNKRSKELAALLFDAYEESVVVPADVLEASLARVQQLRSAQNATTSSESVGLISMTIKALAPESSPTTK